MTTIGDKIAELRKQKGLTQEKLADIIGVSAQSVSKWENSATMPDIMLLPMIADIFDVTIDSLFGKTAVKKSDVVSVDEIPNAAYYNLLETMQKVWNNFDKADGVSEEKLVESVKNTEQYLKTHPDSHTAIFSDGGGAVYANHEIGIIFKKTDDVMTNLLRDEKAAEMLNFLSNKIVRTIMEYQLKSGATSFTAASIASKCELDISDTQAMLDKLVEYAFTSKNCVDVGEGESLYIYHLYAGHKMLLVYSIIRLADRLSDYREHYRGFIGAPSEWFC